MPRIPAPSIRGVETGPFEPDSEDGPLPISYFEDSLRAHCKIMEEALLQAHLDDLMSYGFTEADRLHSSSVKTPQFPTRGLTESSFPVCDPCNLTSYNSVGSKVSSSSVLGTTAKAVCDGTSPPVLPECARRQELKDGQSMTWRRTKERDSGRSSLKREDLQAVLSKNFQTPKQNTRTFQSILGDEKVTRLGRFVQSAVFDTICAVAVVFNMILIGLETHRLTTTEKISDTHRQLEIVFNVWYVVELIFRIGGERIHFMIGKNCWFNLLDSMLAIISIVDLWHELTPAGVQVGRMFRTVRLFRVIRAIRMLRIMRYIAEFRRMVIALANSVQTLVWSMLILFLVIYTYGVWFTAGIAEYKWTQKRTAKQVQNAAQLDEHFGSISKTFYTLFVSITGGRSWHEFIDSFKDIDSAGVLAILFLSFIVICIFGVLNIVTSVFVDSAMQSTQKCRDLMIAEKQKNKGRYVQHIRDIFSEIDTDHSGTIGPEEMVQFVEDKGLELQEYFEALELDASDAHLLFSLLDEDNSGCIDVDEFCEGCLRLKGEARSFDINCMIHESRKNSRNMEKFFHSTEQFFGKAEQWFHNIAEQNSVIYRYTQSPLYRYHAV